VKTWRQRVENQYLDVGRAMNSVEFTSPGSSIHLDDDISDGLRSDERQYEWRLAMLTTGSGVDG